MYVLTCIILDLTYPVSRPRPCVEFQPARVTPLSLKHVKSKNQDKIGKNWGKKIARFLFWTATNNSKPHLKLERPAKFA